ncbi:MAG: dTMP kinase [Tissierellia bacterium]|nr:dTMP kinase [Tissierellia bacterium]
MSLFVTFEGPDGCGKSTISNLIYEELSQSYSVIRTREPGGTRIGERIRQLILNNAYQEMNPRTEALLYAASRAQHVEERIKPALAQGKIVLCERYVLSSIAYQGYGRRQKIEDIVSINEFAIGGLKPDIIFLFQTGEGTLHRKLMDRPDRLENEGDTFHRRVRKAYEDLTKDEEYHVIDASKTIDEVFLQCMKVLREYGGLK